MKVTIDIDDIEADALANFCHIITFFDIMKNATSKEQAQCINDALLKIETELLTDKAML